MNYNLGGLKTIRRKHVISILICVYLILPQVVQVSSATVWSDDFNDGNLNGWTTFGLNMTGEVAINVPANYTLDENNLRYTGEFSTYAYHASAITSGSWSFDVDCVDTPRHHFYIAFMSSGKMDPEDIYGSIPAEYGLAIVTDTFASFDSEFVLYRRAAGDPNIVQIIDRYSLSEVSGWYHIDISREPPGNFDVYINGTHRMEGTATTTVTSVYFSFGGAAGPAIDNVIVTDVPIPDPTTTPTTTTGEQPPSDMTGIYLVFGGIAVVVVIVIVVLMKKRG